MKKLFTFLAAIIVCHSVFATATTSGNWRWRNDNGDDISKPPVPTWAAPENTAITLTSGVQHVRLRLTNYSGSQTGSGSPQLAYSTNSTPTAFNSTPIPTTAGRAFKMVSSTYVTNGQSSPTQISDASGVPFYNSYSGAIYTTANGPGNQTEVQNAKNEVEFNFVPSTGVATGTTYYFVLTAAGQVPGNVLSGYPSLSVAAVLPVTFTAFNVLVDANGNELISWTTASESNSANYVIESSIDGVNFSPVADVASKNLLSGASYAYTYSKGLPTGTNYFRLKAVDRDGTFTYSEVKLINIASSTSKITIAPNPVINALNIAGAQKGNTIQLFNTNGQKILSVVATGTSLQQINVGNLSHGSYYVQVVNEGKVIANQSIIKQ